MERPFAVSSEAQGFPKDLVHAVSVRPRSNAAEGIGAPCRGINLSPLRQDASPHLMPKPAPSPSLPTGPR